MSPAANVVRRQSSSARRPQHDARNSTTVRVQAEDRLKMTYKRSPGPPEINPPVARLRELLQSLDIEEGAS